MHTYQHMYTYIYFNQPGNLAGLNARALVFCLTAMYRLMLHVSHRNTVTEYVVFVTFPHNTAAPPQTNGSAYTPRAIMPWPLPASASCTCPEQQTMQRK